MALLEISTQAPKPEYGHHLWMSTSVGAARRKFKFPYPNMYMSPSEPNALQFNATQRGHQNCLEMLPSFLAMLLIAGLRFPVFAAAAGVVYNIGRIIYFLGYSTGDPNARHRGSIYYLGIFMLLGANLTWAGQLLMSKYRG